MMMMVLYYRACTMSLFPTLYYSYFAAVMFCTYACEYVLCQVGLCDFGVCTIVDIIY